MTRNLKALGLALLAMFAMGALATSASAEVKGFEAKEEKVDLTGTSDEGGAGSSTGTQTFDRGTTGPAIVCHHAAFAGTVVADPKDKIGDFWRTSTLELTADYTTVGCTGPLASEVHTDFTTAGCGYHFTLTANTTADAELVCSKGSETVTITPTIGGSSLCTIHVKEQKVGGHVILHNIANGDVTATATATGITSTRVGNAACGAAHEADGTYNGNVIIEGFQHNSVHGAGTAVEIKAE